MTRAPYCVATVNHACDDLIIAGTVADSVGRGLTSAGAVARQSHALKDVLFDQCRRSVQATTATAFAAAPREGSTKEGLLRVFLTHSLHDMMGLFATCYLLRCYVDEVVALARKTLPFSIGGMDSEISVYTVRKIVVENLIGYLSPAELRRESKDRFYSAVCSLEDYSVVPILVVPTWHMRGGQSSELC